GRTSSVGHGPANNWGLSDFHGNVNEWVADWYDEYYYFDTPGADPRGPQQGELKVCRGGSWASPATDCRSATRNTQPPDRSNNTTGFRLVMMIDGQ
ncbi:MAG: formylglycine-generating enzyme family protein, partial [Gemmataceae bacterium]